MARPLSDSAVVITGGTSGVGLASAQALAAAGVERFALIGRNHERGEAARGAVLGAHPGIQVEFLAYDAADPGQAEKAATDAHERLGAIDVLVNSTASVYVPTLLRDTPIAEIPAMLSGQALPPLLMSRAVLPFMIAGGGGAIINFASDAAKVPTPGETVLGGSMAAIVTFTRTLAVEAKRDGIRVNGITPSLIEGTVIGDKAMEGGFSRKLFEKARAQAHLGMAEPDDFAALVVFLAGPGAAKLTGQIISVNGGISVA
jgi:NAD(P)-dependent dehydrogenase (short-subunit alcohol dehydrogenase family)